MSQGERKADLVDYKAEHLWDLDMMTEFKKMKLRTKKINNDTTSSKYAILEQCKCGQIKSQWS